MRNGLALAAQLFVASSLAACQELGLPEQGFVTQRVGSYGDFLRDTMEPSSDFGGRALAQDAMPLPANHSGRMDECERAARARAQDVEVQGFEEDVQKRVYDATLKDCQIWAARR